MLSIIILGIYSTAFVMLDYLVWFFELVYGYAACAICNPHWYQYQWVTQPLFFDTVSWANIPVLITLTLHQLCDWLGTTHVAFLWVKRGGEKKKISWNQCPLRTWFHQLRSWFQLSLRILLDHSNSTVSEYKHLKSWPSTVSSPLNLPISDCF